MIGYKVVTRFHDLLRSCIISDHQHCAYYSQDKWSMPVKGCGPLCVFDNIVIAKDFMRLSLNPEIWECEYKESDYQAIWLAADKEWTRIHKLDLPNGTVLANKVMITRRVA